MEFSLNDSIHWGDGLLALPYEVHWPEDQQWSEEVLFAIEKEWVFFDECLRLYALSSETSPAREILEDTLLKVTRSILLQAKDLDQMSRWALRLERHLEPAQFFDNEVNKTVFLAFTELIALAKGYAHIRERFVGSVLYVDQLAEA
jgi:hypothetical protein